MRDPVETQSVGMDCFSATAPHGFFNCTDLILCLGLADYNTVAFSLISLKNSGGCLTTEITVKALSVDIVCTMDGGGITGLKIPQFTLRVIFEFHWLTLKVLRTANGGR
jgi:hypothetical protein